MGAPDRLIMTNALLRPLALLFLLAASIFSSAQQTTLQVDPAKTTVKFTLDTALHTVHGTFHSRQATLQFDPSSGQISGEVVVDAKSGETGNGMRDRKMHKEILESDTYPEISFRPTRVEGAVAGSAKSSVKVHGTFRIHGVDREIEVPGQVEIFPDHWDADMHFTLPYQKWGMKNPSTLFLKVSDSVTIDLNLAGPVVAGGTSQSKAANQ
jgi:polyisoprenoid-binding protein YceI